MHCSSGSVLHDVQDLNILNMVRQLSGSSHLPECGLALCRDLLKGWVAEPEAFGKPAASTIAGVACLGGKCAVPADGTHGVAAAATESGKAAPCSAGGPATCGRKRAASASASAQAAKVQRASESSAGWS